MKFISVRDFRVSSADIWKMLPKEQEMIVTNNGKPIALLTPLTDSTLEQSLANIRKAKAATAVKLMQQSAVASGRSKMSPGQIEAEIAAARKSKRAN